MRSVDRTGGAREHSGRRTWKVMLLRTKRTRAWIPAAAVVVGLTAACGGGGGGPEVIGTSTPAVPTSAGPPSAPSTTALSVPTTRGVAPPATVPVPTATTPWVTGDEGCVVRVPPAELELPAFYEKGCSVRGLPIVAAAVVSDEALRAAWTILDRMLDLRPETVAAMRQDRIRFGVIGEQQQTLDMPEYADLQEVFPETDWNARARGLGATFQRPLVSVAEENLLCLPSDRYLGESIAVHEFAHTVLQHGIQTLDPAFRGRLEAAYADAMAAGRWADTYAATDADEYWAEGVQAWFATNLEADPPDGVHGPIDTREELQGYDPALAGLIAEVFPASDFTPRCPDGTRVTP